MSPSARASRAIAAARSARCCAPCRRPRSASRPASAASRWKRWSPARARPSPGCCAAASTSRATAPHRTAPHRTALRWLRQQDGWLAALPAKALAEGRIVTGVCTPSAREVRHFYLEVPPGMVLRRGDLVEALAGASIGAGPGPVGRVLRRLEAPPPGALIEYRPPRRLVACVPPR